MLLFHYDHKILFSSLQAPLKLGSSNPFVSTNIQQGFAHPHFGNVTASSSSTMSVAGSSHNNEYLEQLSSLNTSVSQWISRHVSTNPYVDLTPIFKDYKTHLHDIDVKVGR